MVTYDDVDYVELAQSSMAGSVQPQPVFDQELGVSFNMPFTSQWRDLSQVLRHEEVTVKQLSAMRRNDGQARALYRLITQPIRGAMKNLSFVPAEGGEAEAEFIKQMFTLPPNAGGMTTTFERVMSQVLMGIFDGFSPFELVYWSPDRGPLAGKITMRKMAYRDSSTITFLVDDHGGYGGMRQKTYFENKLIDVLIEQPNSVYFAFNEEENPFYGVSYFQAAYKHYDLKAKLYYIAHLAAQRSAVPTRIGTYPAGAAHQDRMVFDRHLSDLTAAQSMAMPEGWKVDAMKEGGAFDFMAFINHHNSQMSKSVLANFFDENQGHSRGTSPMVNFGSPKDEMFLMMLRTIMSDIAATLNNHVIPKFIDWNFGTGLYPSFQWGDFTDDQLSAIKDTFDKVMIAGPNSNVSSQFTFEIEKKISDMFGLEIDYSQIEADQVAQLAKFPDAIAAPGGRIAPNPVVFAQKQLDARAKPGPPNFSNPSADGTSGATP